MFVKEKLKRKLLVLEINEIPWRIIDEFKTHPDLPNINKFFSNAKTYTTIIKSSSKLSSDSKLVRGASKEGSPVIIDSGELSPWITWPTFHRGQDSKEHGIRFLGQDISTFKGKPIWQEFLDTNLSIGVCGSLQSWPPVDPGKEGFYIPDTFSHDKSCYPKYIESFQKYNLDQVQKNGLVIRQKEIFSTDLLQFLFSLPRLGITLSTLAKVTNQLLGEIFNKNFLARRTTFQCILLWDIFKSLYKLSNPPAFSTFFTNHVASVMHRYWHHIFPCDFGESYKDLENIHFATMLFALKAVDDVLKGAMNFCKSNPDITLVFATSMGQDAIKYTSYEGYSAELEDVTKLFKIFGIEPNDYKTLLAMVPQVTIEVHDSNIINEIKECLDRCLTNSDKIIFTSEEAGNTLSITIHTPPREDILLGKFNYKKSNEKESISIGWHEAGIKMHELEEATAYHIKEGVMAIYGNGIKPNDSREKIELSSCKSLLLNLAFGFGRDSKSSIPHQCR